VTRSSAALMEEAARFCARARGSGAPFYRQLRWEGKARRAGLRFAVATGGEEPQRLDGDRGAGGRRWQRADIVARGQGANRGARAVE
jgi:hypothetical protein